MISLKLLLPQGLRDWLAKIGDAGRRDLNSVAGKAVEQEVRRHLADEATRRHDSARELGAQPTGILGRAARGTVSHADEHKAEIIIPTPAVRRAFGPVDISPRNARALTLPIHAYAYGRRAGELRAMGWRLFRVRGKKALFGQLKGEDKIVPLYALVKHVRLRQDRSLLPADRDLTATATRAIMRSIKDSVRKAS